MSDAPVESKRIVGAARLRFADDDALRSYYEEKYRRGGYEGGGYVVHGLDLSALYQARRMERALHLLAPRPTDRILDAGCGQGQLAVKLAAISRNVHAIDIAANAFAPASGRPPNVQFRAMSVEALAYPAGHFDGIVCVETLEHVLNPDAAIREISRVLKPGGHAVLTYPTINRTLAKRVRLSRVVPVSEHLTEWSYRELVAALRNAALAVERAEGIAFDLGPLMPLKNINRHFARAVTAVSLALRGCPSNSLFVVLRLRKA